MIKVGDAFELMPDLLENSVDCAVVDYPWKMDFTNKDGISERMVRSDDTRKNNRREHEHMYNLEDDSRVSEVIDELGRVLTEGSWAFFFCDDRFQDIVRKALMDSDKLILRRNWVWTPGSMGMGFYGRVSHYPIVTATKGPTNRYVKGRPTLLTVKGGRKTSYPTGKPVDLYEEILKPPVLQDGDRLIEPFCGHAPGAQVIRRRIDDQISYWGCDISSEAVQEARNKSFDRGTLL